VREAANPGPSAGRGLSNRLTMDSLDYLKRDGARVVVTEEKNNIFSL
jgi:hypothetical protein